MKQFTTISEIKDYLKIKREKGLKIGFVPTMGALHDGHLHLISRSKQENDLTICSIFVNPIQFNNKADLEKYPRTLARDSKLLEMSGCDIVFAPSSAEIYPEDEKIGLDQEFGMLDKVMEGKFRPGHFKGVAIVVKKLFDIVQPTRAYFGKKDFQQLAIIKYLVDLLKLPVEIIPCETVRESDGLAMSSRNIRLTIAERNLAPKIYETLQQVKNKAGKMAVRELKTWAIKKIHENSEFQVEYLEIGDKDTLAPIDSWHSRERAVAFIAVFLGDVRLIDNIELFS
ncbi:MAG: pantoate--beta-alanine ligase [Bacteroidales bacterium]|nr:pantoate--beta-alanine ligase [Bacteroidales bacterium]